MAPFRAALLVPRARPTLFSEVFEDGFFRCEPSPTNLDTFDFTAPNKLADKIRGEAADLGGLHNRDEVRSEIPQSRHGDSALPLNNATEENIDIGIIVNLIIFPLRRWTQNALPATG